MEQWHANLKYAGQELTVYFTLDVPSEESLRQKCKKCSEEGVYIDQEITIDEIHPRVSAEVIKSIKARLERVFHSGLCTDHLWQLAEQKGIVF